MEKYGLIGNPVGHSFSARYFAEKFEREGVDASYMAHCLDDIDELPRLIRDNPDLVGLNVTSPFKESCLVYIDEFTAEARMAGAVNTIFIKRTVALPASTEVRLIGHNTDIEGFGILLSELNTGGDDVAELLSNQRCDDKKSVPFRAIVLGSGGAAKAVCLALSSERIPVTVVSRNPASSHGKFGFDGLTDISEPRDLIRFISYGDELREAISEAKLIVNATPLGMGKHIGESPAIPYSAVTRQHYCVDLIYNPEKTEFLRQCEERGAVIKNGLTMLIGQAEASWRFWRNNINK